MPRTTKQIQFAVGMAAFDGEKLTTFTQMLLNPYENGRITSGQLKQAMQAILQKYVKASN